MPKVSGSPTSLADIAGTLVDTLKSWEKTQEPDGSPSDVGYATYTSFGPGYNEYATTYKFGKGAHNIRLLNRVSADILLVHMAKMVGFYLKVGSSVLTTPVPRAAKDMIVKESKFIDFTAL